MDETYFDEGPAGNFETATLEISKDLDGNEQNNSTPVSGDVNVARKNTENQGNSVNQVPASRDVSTIPFKHIDFHSFFTDRNEVVEKALKDCQESLINEEEKDIVGSWLLTEISLWDTEKERLVLLTWKAIYSVKYDFISLKILEYNRIPLSQIDTVVFGELIYPPSSLAPKRSISGVRLMWNKGDPLPLGKKWNPFAKDIPWLTYSNHPLFWYKGSDIEKAKFDVEGLHATILNVLPVECNIRTGSIIIENYFGLGALVHNRNGLGFFKIRGKISF
ncbi:tumor protein p63-regulated gene 1-like protein isoform X2 [Nomia melanderi]|uniref:tumor protein p63-regulated gene 1-like protein isoform X2 n=1 Tax=Nomia melanderi TaxID=2448451 RepID=UPI001303FD49|nr:tumor protein p63-regulated gene 1-like protein isoform X2 [Nomia melanderi]